MTRSSPPSGWRRSVSPLTSRARAVAFVPRHRWPARPSAIVELPPEQVVLREDGDSDNTPGWHIALRASEAAVAAEKDASKVAAAIEAAVAMVAEQAAVAPVEEKEAAMAPTDDEEVVMSSSDVST